MRIKVGDKWFEATPDEPIMIELTKADRSNLNNMAPEATKYAVFHDRDKRTKEQKLEWME